MECPLEEVLYIWSPQGKLDSPLGNTVSAPCYPISQIRKPKPREVKQPIHGRTVGHQ